LTRHGMTDRIRNLEGPLSRDELGWPYVGSGSGPANQSPELVARNLPVELGCHTADVRLDRVPTRFRHSQF